MQNLQAFKAKNKVGNLSFMGRVSKDKIGCYLKQADAFIVHLKNMPLFKVTIPSKTQTYMSFGNL